jgi:hypothetical protein
MIIALHIDPDDWSRLLGLWVAPDGAAGFPDCYYPDPEDGFEVGRGRMEVKGEQVRWSAFFWRLQSASPYFAYWSVREAADAPLPELYDQLALEVAESAEQLAAAVPPPGFAMKVPGVTQPTVSHKALTDATDGPTSPFEPDQKLSSLCSFFADDSRLTVVADTRAGQLSVDLALAWGLAYRGDRSLSLVLPSDRAEPTLIRVPWLMPPVRVFTYESATVSEPLPLTTEQSLDWFRGRTWGASDPEMLGDKADWVRPVMDWASIAPQVELVTRSKYVAWHVAGRQVLKMTPAKKRLTIVAGVDSTKSDEWEPPVKVTLTGRADDDVQHGIIAAASRAAVARLSGFDSGHREHRMQSALSPEQLGLDPVWKAECPAWRPGSNRAAYIDFLAKDPSGRVHVVETKIGADTMLVLQGLDYWLWCRANPDHVNRSLQTSSPRLPAISFVVAPSKPGGEPISIYAAAQAEALHREIEWRFVVVDDPDTADGVEPLPPYHLPENHRRADRTNPRWATRLRHHASSAASIAGVPLVRGHSYPDPREGLGPDARPVYDQLLAKGLAHSHIAHVASSQAFALNLLAPLTLDDWTAIAQHHLDDPTATVVQPVEFEYTDPDDSLAEATQASPHATQVDCLVWIEQGRGRRHAMLIEVKLTEDNFSKCSAYTSRFNPRRDVCGQPGPFGGDVTRCFQLANHDREHRRRYDEMLGRPRNEPHSFGCWFRDGANQVMRNVALAKSLIARRLVQSASMTLMAPDAHTTIWEQWQRHTNLLSQYDGITFADLPASQIAAFHPPDRARELSTRYLLPLDVLDIRLAQRLLDRRFPSGAALTRLNGDGSVNYVQNLERLPVLEADENHIAFTTYYPAGPFMHQTPRTSWAGATGDIMIPDPDGVGSRIISDDLSPLNSFEREHTPSDAARSRQRSPWWTAPFA